MAEQHDRTSREPHLWTRIVAEDPEHSHRYADRWRAFREAGRDIDGEARLIDAMAQRDSHILDAGCGTGRTGGYLLRAGHSVVGVDLDPVLIGVARREHPEGTWLVGDLADLDALPEVSPQSFDLTVMAGNVMTFIAPSLRREALSQLRSRLVPGGRAVIGFGEGRGYAVSDFRADASAAGLHEDLLLATWDLQPWTPESGFLVAVLSR